MKVGLKAWGGFAAALLLGLVLAILATTPPAPRGADTPATEFSAARAMQTVTAISAKPRPNGSAYHAAVVSTLAARLGGMGLDVTIQRGPLGDYAQKRIAGWSGDPSPGQAANIVARLPGTDPAQPAVALMAHHDSVWGSPGAADDAAGVAAIVETVRALKAGGPLKRDVLVVLTDAEELGLDGARIFFTSDPQAARVGSIVNLEARGGGGIASMFQTAPGNGPAIALYARSVAHPSTSSLSAFLYSVLPNDTDLSVPFDQGFAGSAYNIAFIGRSGLYHSPLATPERLDRGSLQQMGEATLSLARTLADEPGLPARGSDAIFFDVFGLFTVHYAPWLGWVMLLLGAAGFAVGWLRTPDRRGVVAGVLRMTGFLVVTGAGLYLLNRLSGSPGEYYDRLAAIPKLMGMAGVAVIAAFVAVFASAAWHTGARIGAAIPLLALAMAGQVFAPTAAYFVVIPVMLAGLVEFVRARLAGAAARPFAVVVGGLVAGYMLSLGFQIMQGVGPTMPFAVALPAALAALVLLPLAHKLPRWREIAGLALLAAVAMALWVRIDPVAPTVAAYASDKPG